MKQFRLSPLIKPVRKTVTVPGSKSITNRALLLAALTRGKVRILGSLVSKDTQAMISCLEILGIKIRKANETIEVTGDISGVKNKHFLLDAKLSGLTLRFLLALSCILPGEKIITGEKALLRRPIKDLVDSLRKTGANIEYLEKEGFPPVAVTSNKLNPGTTSINGAVSSQFLSALLMISPSAVLSIKVEGGLVSKPYVDLTIDIMKRFGIKVHEKNQIFSTEGTYKATTLLVEGDMSSACYFAAIAALTKSTITIENIQIDSKQGDKEFFSILSGMGNEIVYTKNAVTVIGKCIKPVIVNMGNCPDQIQTVAVLAACANGQTKISGISTLRVKETDRVAALTAELDKMGIKTETTNDSIVIHGGNPHGATIKTYNDHRTAMSFAIVGTAVEGITIKDPDVVTKTFPDFWDQLKKVGVKISKQNTSLRGTSKTSDAASSSKNIQSKNIVLIGFMGAGKSSVAPLLARKLKFDVLEMDDLVLKKSEKRSIKEIFQTDGEEQFRELEHRVAKSLQNKTRLVISAGGGVVMKEETMEKLKQHATIVFLSTAFEAIEKRLIDTSDRPLWKDISQTKKLFALRKPLYEQYADIIVSTDGKSLGIITDEIEKSLEENI